MARKKTTTRIPTKGFSDSCTPHQEHQRALASARIISLAELRHANRQLGISRIALSL